MAIVQKRFELNDIDFIRTYSDAGRYVVGGEPYGEYEEACDPAELGRTYTEGELIPRYDEDPTADEVLDIIFGGDEL